ncbi:hypothetical protein L3X38_023602 [Prunus dulcis]|uniref:Uncharacterized protein n=1 Tax=Prunus dulcis TaxID=3755 RepID=A0AAD4Z5H0_PRUDU|nr:hypothetical protein L3X38_023602 [Prunus dulcis]
MLHCHRWSSLTTVLFILPHENHHAIVDTSMPKHVVDLVKLLKARKTSVAAENMAEQVQTLREEMKEKLERTNAKFTVAANKCCRVKLF